MAFKRLDLHYTAWVENLIRDFASKHKSPYESDEFYLSNNLLFATFNFDGKNIKNRARRQESHVPVGETQIEQFTHFYNLVCRRILGRDYHKIPRENKPLCLVSLDANGSRYWRDIGEIDNLHLHSIWVMKPGTIDKFDECRFRALSNGSFDFSEIHVEPFRADQDREKSLRTLISYTLKLDSLNRREAAIDNTIRIYPERDRGAYGLKQW